VAAMTEQNVRREISELEKLIEAGIALVSKRQILADEDLKLIQRRLVVRVARQKMLQRQLDGLSD
jgi:hypothetical protein